MTNFDFACGLCTECKRLRAQSDLFSDLINTNPLRNFFENGGLYSFNSVLLEDRCMSNLRLYSPVNYNALIPDNIDFCNCSEEENCRHTENVDKICFARASTKYWWDSYTGATSKGLLTYCDYFADNTIMMYVGFTANRKDAEAYKYELASSKDKYGGLKKYNYNYVFQISHMGMIGYLIFHIDSLIQLVMDYVRYPTEDNPLLASEIEKLFMVIR